MLSWFFRNADSIADIDVSSLSGIIYKKALTIYLPENTLLIHDARNFVVGISERLLLTN